MIGDGGGGSGGMYCLRSEIGDVLNSENHHRCSVSSSATLIPEEIWERAEEVTKEIVRRIHPTVDANCRRKKVIEYVQGLVKSSLGVEVFPYGSVPLKTYLPDGDIDLTVISIPSIENSLVTDVHTLLKQEEQSKDSQFEVKDVHCIGAEVKLIKCIVDDMVVDISFNQLGGLSALCFLEHVDRIVSKNHIFKRSIILIKSWCYYESRILGAHHGLISTYALETLVLYIFHVFHSSLNGPLAVLYKFLEYFSRFDWDNYCISLRGPVCKSSLPNLVAELPENGRGELLLSEEFLCKCADMFSLSSISAETNSRPFPLKYLNIVDPLKENNNLGRSVNSGNCYRIRMAFKRGALQLSNFLSLPSEKMIDGINQFFTNTLDRHRSNYLTNVQNFYFVPVARNSDDSSLSSISDTSSEDGAPFRSTVGCNNNQISGRSSSQIHFFTDKTQPNFATSGEISCILKSEVKENHYVINNSICPCSNHEVEDPYSSLNSTVDNLTATTGENDSVSISGRSQSFKSLLDLTGDYESNMKSVVYGQYCHFYAVSAPMLLCPSMLPQSNSMPLKQNTCSARRNGVFGQQQFPLKPGRPFIPAFNCEEKQQRRGTGTYIPIVGYHTNRGQKYRTSGINDELHRHTDRNGFAAKSEENVKEFHRRTDRNGFAAKSEEDVHEFHRRTDRNGFAAKSEENVKTSESDHELSESEYPYLGNGKTILSEFQPSRPSVWGGSSNASGCSPPSEKIGSDFLGVQKHEESALENETPDSSSSCISASSSAAVSVAEGPEPVLENNKERIPLQSFHLKDEVEFPPLSLRKALRTC